MGLTAAQFFVFSLKMTILVLHEDADAVRILFEFDSKVPNEDVPLFLSVVCVFPGLCCDWTDRVTRALFVWDFFLVVCDLKDFCVMTATDLMPPQLSP